MPNGSTYPSGSTVVLTDQQVSQIRGAIGDGTLTDNGEVTATAHQVKSNVAQIDLPNGETLTTNQVTVLTPEDFARIDPVAITNGSLTDQGVITGT
jgi:hypothetical protein